MREAVDIRHREPDDQGLAELTEADSISERLAEVVRLATALSDRVLNARFLGQEVPSEQMEALVKAAGLFQDLGEPWPSMLSQALHELADAAQESTLEAVHPSASDIDVAPSPDSSAHESGIKGLIARARKRKG